MSKGILITVRLNSTRLKKKVLLDVNGKPVLKYLTDRLKANFDGKIIICTSTHHSDDPIEKFSKKENLLCFRGSEEDVLDRYYEACKLFSIDKLYIVYGDEPFTDIETMNENFELLDNKIPMWIKNDSLPEGTYGYGMTFKGIEFINNNKLADNLEVWQLMASKMSIKTIELKTDKREYFDNFRFTIDYTEDLEVFSKIIDSIKNRYLSISLSELENMYQKMNFYKINGFRIKEYEERIQQQGTLE